MKQIFKVLTYNSAKILRVKNYCFKMASPVNLVILNANSEMIALCLGAEALYVIKNGKIIAHT